MGTKIHCKSYLPGYYSMRDLNEDSISSSWPLFNGDKTVANVQYINGYQENDKDALKQKIIEHDTVFRNQVYELHRLYGIQRDMMEEVKRKELHKQRASIEPSSSSSSLQGLQTPTDDARKWHMAGFPLSNSGHDKHSILGVEITKGKEIQTSRFLYTNRSTSRDCEALDSRPLKVRSKLFDLQLPAEEYVDSDEGENLPEYKVPDISRKARIESEDSFLRTRACLKAYCPIDASASGSCLRSSVGLADLNEPLQIEEPMAPLPVDFHGYTSSNGETKGMNQSAKSNERFSGVTREGFLMNSSVENEIEERGRFSYMYEAGSGNKLGTQSEGLPQYKLPMPYHPVQATLNPLRHAPGTYPSVLWRDGSQCGEFYSHLEPVVASQNSHTFFSSPCSTGSQAHSISSWAKPKSSCSQRITTSGSPLIQEPFGGKWQANYNSRFNAGLRIEETTKNGFFHGSASGSKELESHLPSAGFGYLNCTQGDKVVSDRSINHKFRILAKGSCHVDPKLVLDLNLNEVASSSSNEPWARKYFNTKDGESKHEDHVSALPWLISKPTSGNERESRFPQASLCRNREAVRDLNQPYTPSVILASSDCGILGKTEIAETHNFQKFLGFQIVDTVAPKHEPSSLVSSSTIVDCPSDNNNIRENRIIDINLTYEPEELIANEELNVQKRTPGACYIDLNSCISDCEDPLPSYESQSNSIKVTNEIDLEAPIFLESGDDDTPSEENLPDIVSSHSLEKKAEQTRDEVLRNAADALSAISSSCPNIDTDNSICCPSEPSLADSLLWFVDTVSLCALELESKSSKESRTRDGSPLQGLSEEIDEFEAMTLQLVESKEDDYMLVPEAQIEDLAANILATGTRRGQSRRGRQRRDFQRDILPGLTSLSRHEVAEDLQIFGGLMRATGHYFNSGLTRRNGCRNRSGRGRRRAVTETVPNIIPKTVCTLVQQLNNIGSGLEERSLTGWGKTTRRPRRQRCPAGNPPTIALTWE